MAEGGALPPLHVHLAPAAAPADDLDVRVADVEHQPRQGTADGVGDELLAPGREIRRQEPQEGAEDEDG